MAEFDWSDYEPVTSTPVTPTEDDWATQPYQYPSTQYEYPEQQEVSWEDFEPVVETEDYGAFEGLWAGAKTAVKGLPKIPLEMAESSLRAIRGGDVKLEEGKLDRWINTLSQLQENFSIPEEEAKKRFVKIPFTDFTITQGDIQSAEESIGFSLVNMIAIKAGQWGGGAVGSLGTPMVGKLTGVATGTAAGLWSAQRITTDQFLDMFKDQVIKELGSGEEAQAIFDSIREDLGDDPFWYGVAEAIPEVAGNWLMFGIAKLGKGGVKKLGLKGVTDAVAKEQGSKVMSAITKMGIPAAKAAGMISEELMTETVTQMIQGNIEYKHGLRDKAPTIEEAFKEVLGPVLLATPVLGVGAAALNKLAKDPDVQKAVNKNVKRKVDAQALLDQLFAQPPPEGVAPPADISEIPTMIERPMEGPVTPEEVTDMVEFEEAPEIKPEDVEVIPVEEPEPFGRPKREEYLPPAEEPAEEIQQRKLEAPKGVRIDAIGEEGTTTPVGMVQVSILDGPAKGATFNIEREDFKNKLNKRVEEFAKKKYGAEYPIGQVTGYRGASEETVLKPHQTGAIYIAKKREGATRYATGEERKLYKITTNVEKPFDTSIYENAEKLQEIDDPQRKRQFDQNVNDIVRNGKLFVTTAQKDWLVSQGYDAIWNPQEDAIAALKPEKVKATEEKQRKWKKLTSEKYKEIRAAGRERYETDKYFEEAAEERGEYVRGVEMREGVAPTLEEWRKTYTIEGKKFIPQATTRRARKINRQIDAAWEAQYGRAAKREAHAIPLASTIKDDVIGRAWKAKRTKFTPTERANIKEAVGKRDKNLIELFKQVNEREIPNLRSYSIRAAKDSEVIQSLKAIGKMIGIPSIEVVATDNKRLQNVGASTIFGVRRDTGKTILYGIVFIENSAVYEKFPVLNVLGHEAYHALKIERPDLTKKFEDFMWENRLRNEYDSWAANQKLTQPWDFDPDSFETRRNAAMEGKSVERYVEDLLKEEWLARFAGATWTRKRFLDKLKSELPEVFGKLLDILFELMRRIRETVMSDPMGMRFVDYNAIIKAENMLADMFVDYIKDNKKLEILYRPEQLGLPFGAAKLAMNMRRVENKESIVAASVRIKGKYYTGLTHIDAINNANEQLGRVWDNMDRDDPVRFDGFKTSTGRYVTRGEAMTIAEKAEQLKPEDMREVVGAVGGVRSEEFKEGELRQLMMAVNKQKDILEEIDKKEILGYATESREDILRLLQITGGTVGMEAFLKKAGLEKNKAKRIAAIAASMQEFPFPAPEWTAKLLEDFDKRMPEAKFWYEKTKWLADVFEDKDTLDLFRGLALLSHTSRNKGTLANMVEFVKAWTRWHAGEPVSSGLVEQTTIDRVLNAKTLAKMFHIKKTQLGFEEGDVKVKAFAEAFAATMKNNPELRNALKTVVDVWINRYFFPTRYTSNKKGEAVQQPLTGVQHFRIQQHMREVERILSEKTGFTWTSDMAQASLWFYIREQYELQPDYEKGQEGYDFDQTLRIIAARWAGVADKFADDADTHAYILMKLRDPSMRWILDHYTKKDNDFKMALTNFQGTGLFTGEEWNNQPEDANRPMRIHFFKAGDVTGEVRGKLGAAKRMRAVIETGQIYNLSRDPLEYKKKHNVQKDDHYSLAAMENNMIEDGFVGFQSGSKVILFEPTRVHEMKRYQISVSPDVSQEVIDSIEKEIEKISKAKATPKSSYQKQVLRSILSNVRMTQKMVANGEINELQEWTQEQLKDLLNHPLIDIESILPTEGFWEAKHEPALSAVVHAGDLDILKGQVAQFLQYNGQFTGIISEVLGEVGQRTKPYSKTDEKGKPIYDVPDTQAPSVLLSFKEELNEDEIKELDKFLGKNGFGGATYIPDRNVVLLHHIPKFQTKASFLNNALQAIIDIGHTDPLFNKLANKFDGFNQVWFKHTLVENPWKKKPKGEKYEGFIKRGQVASRDLGFTASPEIVAGAREKREEFVSKGKDLFTFSTRPLDPKAKTAQAQFIVKQVHEDEEIVTQKKSIEFDMDNASEYALSDESAGYTLSRYGQISDVWATKQGRGALAVLSAIANGGKYSVVEKGPQVEWFESFGFEVTGSEGNQVMMQPREGMTNDPFILAGVFEATWSKRLDTDPDSAAILNEIIRQYGETLRTGLGKKKSEKIKKTTLEYLNRNWVTYDSAVEDTKRDIHKPYKNVLIKPDPKAPQKGRALIIQVSSILSKEDATSVGSDYFDLLYSNREGYWRPADFWEIPDWLVQATHIFDADVYVARNLNEAKRFLDNTNYDVIMTSAMDDNRGQIRRLVEGYGGKTILGGYADREYFKDLENVLFLDSLEEAAKEMGVPYERGLNFEHFKGTKTIPRLECSKGCLYKCKFCVQPKTITMPTDKEIMAQVDAYDDVDYKLIYLNDKTFGQAKNYKILSEVYKRIKAKKPDFLGFIIQTTAVDFNRMPREWLEISGIKYVELGAESINDSILEAVRKPHRVGHLEMAANKIRSLGMHYVPNVMAGLTGVYKGKKWSETAETYQNTLNYLEKHKDIISHVNLYSLAAYKQTELAKELEITEGDSDMDEQVMIKSWMKTSANVHESFYNAIVNYGKSRLSEDIDDVTDLRQKKILDNQDIQKIVDNSIDEFDPELADRVAKATQNLTPQQIREITSKFESRRSYEDAPDWMMGFPDNPFRAKGFYEQNYPVTIKVKVKFEDQTFEDEIKGLNVYHALERANRNWEGAKIELLDKVNEKEEIRARWMREPDIEHDTVGDVSDDTKKLLREKIGWEDKSIIEKASDTLDKFVKNWRQQGFDRMQPIAAKLGGEDGEVYMRHRAVPGVMSTAQAFFEHGKLEWDEVGVPVVRTQGQGFLNWLTQGLGKDADRFFYWLIAKRAEVLAEEGRERWLDEESRQKILEWVGEPKNKNMTWEMYNEEFQAFNKSILDFAEHAGLFSADQRAQWEQEFYIPFYRILEDNETKEAYLRGPARGKQHLSSQIRRLYGAEAKLGDPLHNIIRNWTNLIGESMANSARASAYDYAMAHPTMTEDGVAMIEDASLKDIQIYKPKKTKPGEPKIIYVYKKTGEPVLSFMRDGKKVYFKVNDVELFNALSLINRPYFDNVLMRLMGATKHWLTFGATFGPAFKVKNMIRDALHSYTIVPGFRPWHVIQGAIAVWRNDPDYVEFMASGNSFAGSYIRAEDPKAMEKYLTTVMPRENVVDRFINEIRRTEGKTALGRIYDTPAKLLELWKRLGDASENAVRVAIFKKYKAEQDRLVAGFKARDVMDFQMSGASALVQLLIQTIPFLNARAQGLYKMGREARKNPVAYLTKGALIGLASIGLWAIFKDDDRYKEMEDWEKWTYYHFWIGDEHFRIPKPFETGVVWSTMFETFGNVFNGTEEGRHILDFTKFAVGETLAFNPIPQLIRPMAEQYFNKTFFTGRPIEGQRLQNLDWGERYDPWTSETMRLAGKLGIPPKRAEAFVRGYFSTVGMIFLTVSDTFVRNAFGFPERPDMKVDHYPLIGAFYRSAQPQNTKFANRYYDMAEETNRAYSTIMFYRDLGQHKYADLLLEKHQKALIFRKRFNAISTRFSQVNNDIRNTWLSEEMSGEEKSKKLDELYKYKNDILRQLFKDYEGEVKNVE